MLKFEYQAAIDGFVKGEIYSDSKEEAKRMINDMMRSNNLESADFNSLDIIVENIFLLEEED